MEKRIMVYGDSNSWGYMPNLNKRFDKWTRWPAVMATELGEEYYVAEENVNGRTTCFDDAVNDNRNGRKNLSYCLDTQKPLDLVIIMLGNNDVRSFYNADAKYIARCMQSLVEKVNLEMPAAKVLVIAPPHLKMSVLTGILGHYYTEADVVKSRELAAEYASMCKAKGALFFDAQTVIECCDEDGIHITGENHRKLGKHMAGLVKEILG